MEFDEPCFGYAEKNACRSGEGCTLKNSKLGGKQEAKLGREAGEFVSKRQNISFVTIPLLMLFQNTISTQYTCARAKVRNLNKALASADPPNNVIELLHS